MRQIALLLFALCSSACTWPASAEPWDRVHGATLRLEMENATCSGTAIGPFRILTAAHCFPDGKPAHLLANGENCDVWKMVSDGNDHVLLTVGGCSFKQWAKFGPLPKVGDVVWVWGNPGAYSDLLRFGTMAGYATAPIFDGHVTLFDLNSYYGDSGSAIFNARGQIVGVLSIGTFPYKLMGSFALKFTAKQWAGL